MTSVLSFNDDVVKPKVAAALATVDSNVTVGIVKINDVHSKNPIAAQIGTTAVLRAQAVAHGKSRDLAQILQSSSTAGANDAKQLQESMKVDGQIKATALKQLSDSYKDLVANGMSPDRAAKIIEASLGI